MTKKASQDERNGTRRRRRDCYPPDPCIIPQGCLCNALWRYDRCPCLRLGCYGHQHIRTRWQKGHELQWEWKGCGKKRVATATNCLHHGENGDQYLWVTKLGNPKGSHSLQKVNDDVVLMCFFMLSVYLCVCLYFHTKLAILAKDVNIWFPL